MDLVPCAEAVKFTSSGTEATLLALRGWGVLALAIGQLVQWTATTIVVYGASRWRPSESVTLP